MKLTGTFWRLWLSTASSNLSDGIGKTAFPLLAAAITRDPVQVSLVAGGGTLRWNGADHLIAEPELIDATQAEAAFSRWQRAGVRAFGMATFMRVRRVDQPSGDPASRPASRTNR